MCPPALTDEAPSEYTCIDHFRRDRPENPDPCIRNDNRTCHRPEVQAAFEL